MHLSVQTFKLVLLYVSFFKPEHCTTLISKWNKIWTSGKLIYINNRKEEKPVSVFTEPTVNADLKMLATNFKSLSLCCLCSVQVNIHCRCEETGVHLHIIWSHLNRGCCACVLSLVSTVFLALVKVVLQLCNEQLRKLIFLAWLSWVYGS